MEYLTALQKLETRSQCTRSNINLMMLNLDETSVKLSNLTRINSIKNTIYIENLIQEDHLDLDGAVDSSRSPQKELVVRIVNIRLNYFHV